MERWKLVRLLILGALIGLLMGCTIAPYSIRYVVTGSASRVSVTIDNASGGTSQFADVAVPWEYFYSSPRGVYKFVYVSAQNQGENGTVTASIYVDEELFRTSTSSGAYVIATASGSVGSY